MSTSNHPVLDYTPIRPPLLMMEKTIKWKPNNVELAPNCPRCSSSNTKFCYYNNYSVSQPRYFCKACRRYWTKGGSLRNVPIGGSCRKNRRGRTARQDCPPPSLDSRNGSESCGDIDLSAVLANYAKQNMENHESSAFASSEEVQAEDSTIFECGKSMADDHFQQVNECIDDQDFVYQNYDVFKVHELGGDQMLWSEGSNLQIFGSQQPLMVQQLQEFEGFDQRMSENLVTDNWGSFDLSAYEDF